MSRQARRIFKAYYLWPGFHVAPDPGGCSPIPDLEAICDSGQLPPEFLLKHQAGDWGEVCEEDRRENDLSLAEGFRLLSAYRTKTGVKIWLITK